MGRSNLPQPHGARKGIEYATPSQIVLAELLPCSILIGEHLEMILVADLLADVVNPRPVSSEVTLVSARPLSKQFMISLYFQLIFWPLKFFSYDRN